MDLRHFRSFHSSFFEKERKAKQTRNRSKFDTPLEFSYLGSKSNNRGENFILLEREGGSRESFQ